MQMEQTTQRPFTGEREIVLIPSTFSRPNSGYLFAENGKKVVVCKSDSDVNELAGTLLHEFLHSLLSGWMTSSEEMKKLIQAQLASEAFKHEWEEIGKREYAYPDNWFDELAVHSFGEYPTYKGGFRSKDEALRRCYTSYMKALCCAAFSKYQEFGGIDDFLYYAIDHIREVEKPDVGFGIEADWDDERLVIANVKEGSDAYRSGLRAHDIVLEANGEPLTRERDAKIGEEIKQKVIGSGQPYSMKLKVLRGHEMLDMDVTVMPKSSIRFEFRE